MNNECWTEMDLYWFQGEDMGTKVKMLFDRLVPLWNRAPKARKGLSLCLGWLHDSVLYWNGRLDDRIFTCQPPRYEPWTYRDLRNVLSLIRKEATDRRLSDFHIALMLTGGRGGLYAPEKTCEGWGGRTEESDKQTIYYIEGKWFNEHLEVDEGRYGIFYFGSTVLVPEDEAVCKLASPTLSEYFADKLCDMCRHTGFDAVVFRDNIFSPAYRRGNRNRYMESECRRELNDAFISLLARIKANLPGFTTIGYSSGISSMEEWRSHGFDLEKVAMSGYLDLWITQTWASAWQDYWPCHSMGFTFQLANLLVNMAMLAGTPCGHMFLIETFDAWEPWDSIHQYPSKVAWEIWAYSHASVLMQDGAAKHPDGFYVSWMNRGSELIPEKTIGHLCSVLDDCSKDLEEKPVPGGPCLVFHRKGIEYLLDHPCTYSRGEEMDDWTAMLQKYGAPVLSITRSEWLHGIDSDAFIFPVPVAIGSEMADSILSRLGSGTLVMFTGSAGSFDDALRARLGITVLDEAVTSDAPSAACVEEGLAGPIGTRGLVINQRQRTLSSTSAWRACIDCLGGPVFARHKDLPCFIWETPEWGTPTELHLTAQSVQSPQTYNCVATAIGETGWGREGIRWTNEDWQKPVCFLFWRYAGGGTGVLLGNLETGFTGNSQFCVKGVLSGNLGGSGYTAKAGFGPGWVRNVEAGMRIAMSMHKAYLLRL